MQKLNLVEAETLLYEPLEKPSFVVDGLIPTGLSLFCGSQKIGKSWLMLKLCLCVSQGLPLWDMPTKAGDVQFFHSVPPSFQKLSVAATDKAIRIFISFPTTANPIHHK